MDKPTLRRVAALLPAGWILASGCRDVDPVAPAGVRATVERATPAGSIALGCASSIVTGSQRVVTEVGRSEPCLDLRIVARTAPGEEPRPERFLLEVAVENVGTRAVTLPALLRAGPGSLAVLEPRGLRDGVAGVAAASMLMADSVAEDTASGGPAHIWRLHGQDEATVLPPGGRTEFRAIEIRLHPGVRQFRLDLESTAPFRVTTAVPAAAPDTVPAGLYAPENILLNSPHFWISDKVARDLVNVTFREGATRAERQAAIDGVGGEVIGGMRMKFSEGDYLVRVEDDGTGAGLKAAADLLNAHPAVLAAGPEYLFDPEELLLSRMPVDGSGWDDYSIDRVDTSGERWGLEAISAPLAWGCETGSISTRIGIVDHAFEDRDDLVPNIVESPHLGNTWIAPVHGTFMSSIIAARGDNRMGITGVMWRAGLRQYDWHEPHPRDTAPNPTPLRQLRFHLEDMLTTDVAVVNLSVGVQGAFIPGVSRADAAERVQLELARFVEVLRTTPNQPLLVISAGNRRRDAFWSVLPGLAAHFPTRVIVVGGAQDLQPGTAALWVDSRNGGGSAFNDTEPEVPWDLVRIAAPAKEVGGLGRFGTSTASGTSQAAAFVSGIAGLLKSFDPGLTTEEIRALLLEGARRANHRVFAAGDHGDSVFVANAYESLRAAAERPGAPLCGNRVWNEGGSVKVERMLRRPDGGRSPIVETIHSGATPVELFDAMHGGKALRVFAGFGADSLTWTPGGWTTRSLLFPSYFQAGGNASIFSGHGYTHDRNKRVGVEFVGRNGPIARAVDVVMNGERRASIPISSLSYRLDQQCNIYYNLEGTGVCGFALHTSGDSVSAIAAPAPSGRAIMVAITYHRTTAGFSGGFAPCSSFAGFLCRPSTWEASAVRSDVHHVDLVRGTTRLAWSQPGGIVYLSLSEDGEEVATNAGMLSESVTTFDDRSARTRSYSCTLEYRRVSSGAYATAPISSCDRNSIPGFAP